MHLLDPEMAELRQRYYRNRNIGWVVRSTSKREGFIQTGRLKKASNMSFAKNLAYQIEQRLHKPRDNDARTEDDEENACQEFFSHG